MNINNYHHLQQGVRSAKVQKFLKFNKFGLVLTIAAFTLTPSVSFAKNVSETVPGLDSKVTSNLDSIKDTTSIKNHPFLIAYAIVDEKCESSNPEGGVYEQGETKNYLVIVCYGKSGNPGLFIVRNKSNKKEILFPVPNPGKNGIDFVGRCGKDTYTLSGDKFIITRSGKKPRTENVIWDTP
jgi:hypothetical protein